MRLLEVADGPTREAFYNLAESGVWVGFGIACLLAFVLGQYFIKAVF